MKKYGIRKNRLYHFKYQECQSNNIVDYNYFVLYKNCIYVKYSPSDYYIIKKNVNKIVTRKIEYIIALLVEFVTEYFIGIFSIGHTRNIPEDVRKIFEENSYKEIKYNKALFNVFAKEIQNYSRVN